MFCSVIIALCYGVQYGASAVMHYSPIPGLAQICQNSKFAQLATPDHVKQNSNVCTDLSQN